jgi:hypothetical protein
VVILYYCTALKIFLFLPGLKFSIGDRAHLNTTNPQQKIKVVFVNKSVFFLIAEDVNGDEITKDPETAATSLEK